MPKSGYVTPFLMEALKNQHLVTRWSGEVYEAWEWTLPRGWRWLPHVVKNTLTRAFGRYSRRNVGPHHEKEKDRYIVKRGCLDLSLENEQRIEANRTKLVRHK